MTVDLSKIKANRLQIDDVASEILKDTTVKETLSTKQDKSYYIITEDMVTVTKDATKGVAPYNTSYGYTNITIGADKGVEWKNGALYNFIIDTTMAAASAYRNVRVRIGDGDWKPLFKGSAIAQGNAYFIKAYSPICTYETKYQSGGALGILADNNTTYSTMTAAELTTGTATTGRVMSAKVLADWQSVYHDDTKQDTISDLATIRSGASLGSTALQSYTETDPTVPSHVKSITQANITSWHNKSDFSGNYNDLTNKPTIPTVPTNVSAFNNDSGYITSAYHDSTKQDTLVSGTNIKTVGGESLLGSGNISIEANVEDFTDAEVQSIWNGVFNG